jgi:hypothetical protein
MPHGTRLKASPYGAGEGLAQIGQDPCAPGSVSHRIVGAQLMSYSPSKRISRPKQQKQLTLLRCSGANPGTTAIVMHLGIIPATQVHWTTDDLS